MTRDRCEGWHTDPFGLHDARWMSDGVPTKLVRDGAHEFYEAVPAGKAGFDVVPTPIQSPAANGEDLRRSDREVDHLHDALSRAAASILVHTHT